MLSNPAGGQKSNSMDQAPSGYPPQGYNTGAAASTIGSIHPEPSPAPLMQSQVKTLISTVALLMEKMDQLNREREQEKMVNYERNNKMLQDNRFMQMVCNDNQTQIVNLKESMQSNFGAQMTNLRQDFEELNKKCITGHNSL